MLYEVIGKTNNGKIGRRFYTAEQAFKYYYELISMGYMAEVWRLEEGTELPYKQLFLNS